MVPLYISCRYVTANNTGTIAAPLCALQLCLIPHPKYTSGPSIYSAGMTALYRHYTSTIAALFRTLPHWFIPSVPSDPTGTMIGNWHYSTGTIEGALRCRHCRRVLRIEIVKTMPTSTLGKSSSVASFYPPLGKASPKVNHAHGPQQGHLEYPYRLYACLVWHTNDMDPPAARLPPEC